MTIPMNGPAPLDVDHREPPLLGQWAVVTGASKGIGRAIAEGLHGAGANVVLAARGADALAETKGALDAAAVHGQTVMAVEADTADPRSVERLFARVGADLPHLNVVIANAGSGHLTPFPRPPTR
jgi:glucose 1-dehydrogenase